MNRYDFMIKVADLLHESGSHDTIEFINKFSTRFPQLVEPGMNMSIEVLGLNDTDLTLTVYDLRAPVIVSCDSCGEMYSDTIMIKEETIKASTDPAYDEMLLIDKKNERIDIEQWITDLLLLSMPVQSLCKDCEKNREHTVTDINDYTTVKRISSQK